MERRPFGRGWGLSLRMALTLVLLGALYLPFFLWLVAMGYFISGGMVAILVALGALGLLACAPYLSELLALSLARADRDGGPETIRLQPILERLCAMADVPVPRLAVMPTDVPNAFSAGRNARNASSSSREASSIASTRRSSKRSSPMSWPTSPTGTRSS